MNSYPEGVRIEKGQGGLERLVLAAADGEAHIYLHGANVAHFQPRGGRPVIMVSSKAVYEGGQPGKAIRGGVPICFPWFGGKAGDASAPVHGVARLWAWGVESVTKEADGRLRATLTLASNDDTRAAAPGEFALRYVVTVGASLEMALTVQNTGSAPLTFEDALHTYFAVSDVRQIAIAGLEKASYIDKTDSFTRKVTPDDALKLTGETDRVFVGATGAVTITDPGWYRRVVVSKSGSNTTIVWNPWSAKAKTIVDLGDDDWTGMVCVEAGNAADNTLTLAPGATHTLTASIEVGPLGRG